MKKTIADFKRKMRPGTYWRFMAYYLPSPVYRKCTGANTANFKLEAVRPEHAIQGLSGFCDWPKTREITWVMDDSGLNVKGVRININPDAWIYYEPVND